MLRILTSAALAGGMLLAGCNTDTLVKAERPDLPDVHGAWEFSLTGYPVGTQGQDGHCDLGPITLELTQAANSLNRDTLSGTHTAGSLVCYGLTPYATQVSGMVDTVMPFDAGLVSGIAGLLCTEPPGFVPGLPCAIDSLKPWLSFSFIGQEFGGLVGSTMGGSFHWQDTIIHGGPSTVVYGNWSARR